MCIFLSDVLDLAARKFFCEWENFLGRRHWNRFVYVFYSADLVVNEDGIRRSLNAKL